MDEKEFPLRYRTPDRWAESALKDVVALLNDHAFLERKAATNALDLLHRWLAPAPPDVWMSALTTVARDEAQHLNDVAKLLMKRGGTFSRGHKSGYASDLRELVRAGRGPEELVDRLLVSALIEARSCERFEILSRQCPDKELAAFYRGLEAAERGHYAIFLRLAGLVIGEAPRDSRWETLVKAEAKIIENQPPGSHLHSGLPN